MDTEKKEYYLGIDLNDDYAMISYFQSNMSEPETAATIAGSEMYRIPAILARRKNLGLWYYGDEARKMAKNSEVVCVESLLRRAVNHEVIGISGENFDAVDLLALFLRKVIEIPQKLGNYGTLQRLVITVERLTRENMEVFWKVASRLGVPAEHFTVVDHKESFYYFALSQKEDLWLHDVYLFDCEQDFLYSYDLKRDMRTTPQVVSIRESARYSLSEDRDNQFLKILQQSFENRIISTVYLVGDGFEGDWMKQSLNFI